MVWVSKKLFCVLSLKQTHKNGNFFLKVLVWPKTINTTSNAIKFGVHVLAFMCIYTHISVVDSG